MMKSLTRRALARRALASRRLQEADSGETSEHRQTEKCRRLPLRKIRRAIDEIAEASVADFLRRVVNIFSRRIDAPGCERHVIFECACRIPDIAGEAADEIGARALLFTRLILEPIRGSGRSLLGGIGRLLEFVACGIRRCPQYIAGALFDLSAGIRHLVLQVLGRAGILALGKILIAGVNIHIAHGGLYLAVGFREGSKAVVTTSSATSLSSFGYVLGDTAGVSAKVGLGNAFCRGVCRRQHRVLGGLKSGLSRTRRRPV